MNHYRIYSTDVSGKIMGPPEEILCPNDVEALEGVRKALKDRANMVEIWQGTRLAATWDVPPAAMVQTDPCCSVSQLPAQTLPQPVVALDKA
jgi:hypothetical protein